MNFEREGDSPGLAVIVPMLFHIVRIHQAFLVHGVYQEETVE